MTVRYTAARRQARRTMILALVAAAGACTRDRVSDAAGQQTVAVPATAAIRGGDSVTVGARTPAAAESALAAPALVAVASVAAPTPRSLGAPPAEVRAVCDSVAGRWRAIPRAVVESADTVALARETDHDADPHLSYAACVVTGRRDEGLDSTMQHLRFWPASAWTRVWKLDADGPDGSFATYQRGMVRCHVWEQWDGGDDGDSTYVPSPFYEEQTICWRHRYRVLVTDTLHEEP